MTLLSRAFSFGDAQLSRDPRMHLKLQCVLYEGSPSLLPRAGREDGTDEVYGGRSRRRAHPSTWMSRRRGQALITQAVLKGRCSA